MAAHRSSERSLYDKLQQPECDRARELLDLRLASTDTYEQICEKVNTSQTWQYRAAATGEVCALPVLTPQKLSRYRARKHYEETRATVKGLIERESADLLDAAAKNPAGEITRYLRKRLAEEALARFDADIAGINPVDLSREAARHALVDQRDRKLNLDEEKIGIDRKRVELQERQSELQRDRFDIAAETWRFTLTWMVGEEPEIADRIAARSEEFLSALEDHLAGIE